MDPQVLKLLDLAATTISQYPKNKYRNLLLGHEGVAIEFIRDAKERDMTGLDFKFNAIAKGNVNANDDATVTGTGRYDGAWDKIPIGQQEFQVQGSIDWAHYITSASISELEIIANSGEEGFIDIKNQKIEGIATIFAQMIASQFWSRTGYQYIGTKAPAILGPEYYVTDDGFAINDPAGTNHVKVAGIDPTDDTLNDDDGRNRWRNQFFKCVTPNALLDALDYMWTETQFKAPEGVAVNTSPDAGRRRIITNKSGFKTWQKLMRRLGEPLDPNKPTYNNLPIEWSDRMAARPDETNQVFFLDRATWTSRIAKGKNFSRSPMRTPDGQPNVRSQYIELWPALGCVDRRMNGKIFGFGNELLDG